MRLLHPLFAIYSGLALLAFADLPQDPAFRELQISAPEKPAGFKPSKPGMDVFIRLDSDKDGKLRFEEWKASPKPRANPNRLEALFGGLDTDHDQSLGEAEFTARFK